MHDTQGAVCYLLSRQINIKLTSYKMSNSGSHLATMEQLFGLTTSKPVTRPSASCYISKSQHTRALRQILASLTFPSCKLRIMWGNHTRHSPASSLAASILASLLTRGNESSGQLLVLWFFVPTLCCLLLTHYIIIFIHNPLKTKPRDLINIVHRVIFDFIFLSTYFV